MPPAPPLQPLVDPNPFQEFAYSTCVAAKLAITDYLVLPLAKLSPEHLAVIEVLLSQTLRKHDVFAYIRTTIQPTLRNVESPLLDLGSQCLVEALGATWVSAPLNLHMFPKRWGWDRGLSRKGSKGS